MGSTSWSRACAKPAQSAGANGPSRVFEFRPDDVREVRHKLGLSQREFAEMIGVSVATLRNWEQGRRRCRRYVSRSASAHSAGDLRRNSAACVMHVR